ncbi:amidase family protein [Facklamia miroungae]|uniref:Asp-tRNAAsn/Glu-tRNAGln amidotransferase A subunit n=1 Tax=Facklamia miroungae TaxID=120956 RepID=A0A1G7RI45_9LACT|nr:amidase family protein [Facklamia miroungae]NKZ29405.1 amidase [Facklamia miroungae]SDG10433.1 Asp-tRNAAsn/Glu-tRNAGln amidotransferase A subunit [Facklamia miroungae]
MKKTLSKQLLLVATLVLNSLTPIVLQVNATEPVTVETSQAQKEYDSQASNLTEVLNQPNNAAINSDSPEKEAGSTVYDSQSLEEGVSQTPLTVEEYKQLDATTLAEMIRSGKTTSQELIELAFQVIEETNPDLNNIISTRKEEALAEAAALEDKGQPFYGVPMLVKGLGHSVEGGINSNGLKFLEDQISQRDGRQVKAFKEAGFIVIGQTSYPQFGWINVTNSELYGDTHNPWNLDHNPGGSSGGSAAAVAIGQVPIASSSDAGGSTRIPASWSGLIGLHPSRGILTWDSSSEKNQTTHFAETKSMQDTITLFETLLKDKTKNEVLEGTFDKSTPIAFTTMTPAGTVISQDAINAVRGVVNFLKGEGYQIEEVAYPVDGKKLMENYYILASSYAGSLDYMAKRPLGRPIQREDVELLTWALYQTSKDLTKEDVASAWENIQQITAEMEAFYTKYPVLLTATNAFPAPKADYNHISQEMAVKMEDMSQLSKAEKLQLIYDQWLPAWTLTPYTQLANLTGTPALSLPTYLTANNLPMGVMFNTFAKNDRSLLQIGKLLEENNRFITYYHRPEKPQPPVNTPETDGGEEELQPLPSQSEEEEVIVESLDSVEEWNNLEENIEDTVDKVKMEYPTSKSGLDNHQTTNSQTVAAKTDDSLPATGEKPLSLVYGISFTMLGLASYLIRKKY